MGRKLVALVSVAVAGISIMAGPAHAGRPDHSGGWIACHFEGDVTFSPGITLAPRASHFEIVASLTDCVSSDPAIVSGELAGHGSGDFSCALNGWTDGRARATITWNDERSTKFEVPVTVTAAGVALFAGPVTGGSVFRGTTFRGPALFSDADPTACNTPDGLKESHLTELSTFA